MATNGGLASNNWLTVAQGGVVTNVSTLSVNTNNIINLFGGTVTMTTLTLQPKAQIGMDIAAPGRMVVQGNATLAGYVNPTNLQRVGKTTRTILTCAGTLSGNLNVGPLPTGYIGSILTNVAASPKLVDLYIVGPSGGTVIIIM